MSKEEDMAPAGLQFPRRCPAAQRIEHAILAVSFTIVGFTRLIQKYAAKAAASRKKWRC